MGTRDGCSVQIGFNDSLSLSQHEQLTTIKMHKEDSFGVNSACTNCLLLIDNE